MPIVEGKFVSCNDLYPHAEDIREEFSGSPSLGEGFYFNGVRYPSAKIACQHNLKRFFTNPRKAGDALVNKQN